MGGREKFIVDWHVHPHQDVFFSSYLLTGLCRLHQRGIVKLRLRTRGVLEQSNVAVHVWDVTQVERNLRRRAMLDTLDSHVTFNEWALSSADVYFKRSHVSAEIAAKFPSLQHKVLPLGLVYACLSREAVPRHAQLAARIFWGAVRARVTPLEAATKRLISDLRMAKGLPDPERFEFTQRDQRDERVIFQTRVWPPEKSADDLDAVNLERIELVKALRAGLGDRFVGGIMKDAHSQQICPEVVVGDNIYRGDYVQFAKRFAVGVYSRGIHHSLAFKLSEYLAAGLCIVSPPFLHELPVPLEPDRHYLPYATLDECVRQCEVLLKDPAKARQMSAENRAYYRQWVEPSAHALDLLKRTFSRP